MRYRTIVADPPWSYRSKAILTNSKRPETKPAADVQYPTMSLEDIAALPVADLAEDDAHLYLWATNPMLPSAFEVMEAWGFTYRTLLTWHKGGAPGLGYYFRGNTEHALFGTRGTLPIAPERREQNWFAAPRQGHSIKPEAFLDLVERVSPEPRIELFARRNRFGWDTWGNESLEMIEL